MVIASGSARFFTVIVCLVGALLAFYVGFNLSRSALRQGQSCVYEPWPLDSLGNIALDKLDWGPCNRDCQGGLRFATRGILVPATDGGTPCDPNQLIISQSCNDTVLCGQPCVPGDPASAPWIQCPTCVKGDAQPYQWKIVPPVHEATYGGKECNINEVFFTKPCDTAVPACPPDIDCVYGFQGQTTCSVPCGSGTLYEYYTISSFSSGDGIPCDFSILISEAACYEGACPDCNSLFPPDGTWSQCNAACGPGIEVQIRDPAGSFSALCPYFRTRSCQITPCENNTCVPPSIDMIQALCYLSCSGLPLPDPPLAPGMCTTSSMFASICDDFNGDFSGPCAVPQDCSVSSWSSYGGCSLFQCNELFPDGGVETRVRQVVQQGQAGGLPCTDPQFAQLEFMPCNNIVPVTWSQWSDSLGQFTTSVMPPQCTQSGCSYSAWYSITSCSALCTAIPGNVELERSVTSFPVAGGATCSIDPDFYFSQSSCTNAAPCTSCTWQPWTSITGRWTTCPPGYSNPYFPQFPDPVPPPSNFQSCGFPAGQTCSTNTLPLGNFIAGQNLDGTYKTHTCSAYAIECSAFNCPMGCNGHTCSGVGTPVFYPNDGNVCSCSCPPWYGGEACNIQPSVTCGVNEYGLECSGIGTCVYTSETYNSQWAGSCSCPFGDTTSDCSGQASSWCWIYSTIRIDNPSDPLKDKNQYVRKLLGAVPILESPLSSFTVDDCLRISQNGTFDPNDPFYPFKNQSMTLAVPMGVTYANGGFSTLSAIQQVDVSGVVQSARPQTLDLAGNCLLTGEFIRLALQYQVPGVNFAQFTPHLLPGSWPPRCESFLEANYFTAEVATDNKQATASTFLFTPTYESASDLNYVQLEVTLAQSAIDVFDPVFGITEQPILLYTSESVGARASPFGYMIWTPNSWVGVPQTVDPLIPTVVTVTNRALVDLSKNYLEYSPGNYFNLTMSNVRAVDGSFAIPSSYVFTPDVNFSWSLVNENTYDPINLTAQVGFDVGTLPNPPLPAGITGYIPQFNLAGTGFYAISNIGCPISSSYSSALTFSCGPGNPFNDFCSYSFALGGPQIVATISFPVVQIPAVPQPTEELCLAYNI